MIVSKNEYHHNTREQVVEYVTIALNIVEELDPPSDLREIAFSKALDMISAKQIVMEQTQPATLGMAIPRGIG